MHMVVNTSPLPVYKKYRITSLLCIFETIIVLYIALCPFGGTQTNGADPDHTPQNAASDQGLHFLLTEYSKKIKMNEK